LKPSADTASALKRTKFRFLNLVAPLLSVVGLVASEYNNEWRGFNESGVADSINPYDSLSYLTNHRQQHFAGGLPELLGREFIRGLVRASARHPGANEP
jgi:hypothetical protein